MRRNFPAAITSQARAGVHLWRFLLLIIIAATTAAPPMGTALAQGSQIVALQSGTAPSAASAPTAEYLLKAAFLYKFAQFTQWPSAAFDEDNTAIHFCVLGENPFGAALTALEGKLVNRRPIVSHVLDDLQAIERCHVLFVDQANQSRVVDTIETLTEDPLLLVGDAGEFARQGGMINFKLVDDTTRFEVNLVSARAAGLVLDTRLLQVADQVYTSSPQVEDD